MIDFEFSLATKIVFGKGSQKKVGGLSEKYGRRIMIHYGSERIRKSGILTEIEQLLQEKNLEYIEFGGVKSNPDVEFAQKGVEICRENNIDMILAIGGGSVIDSAKAIGLGACSKEAIWDIYSGRASAEKSLPIGVILTIPAAASESNCTSVLSNYKTHEKKVLYCPESLPKFSILNPQYTLSISEYNTAMALTDIFAHAFERYFDLRKESLLWDNMCEAAMKTVAEIAPKLLANPKDYKLRSEMMWAASVCHNDMLGLGGDFACHELSHTVTAEYGIPHGSALAIIMPSWCRYMAPKYKDKLERFGKAVWGSRNTDETIRDLENFIKSMGLPVTFAEAGVEAADPVMLAEKTFTANVEKLGGGLDYIDKNAAMEIFRDCCSCGKSLQ